MFNDDFADRTLPATERRRNKARAQGQVARSPQITSALILLVASLVFGSVSRSVTINLAESLRRAFLISTDRFTLGSATDRIQTAGLELLSILGPLLGAVAICGLAANLIQAGWLWLPGRMAPQFRMGRLLAGDRVWEAMILSCRSVCLAGWAASFVYVHRWELSGLGANESIQVLHVPLKFVGELGLQLSVILLVFASIDYGYRYWRHEQSLKMTIEERRRELREDSIAPEIKRRQSATRGTTAPDQSVERVSAIQS